jgi:hypothetical protein
MVIERALPAGQSIHRSRLRILGGSAPSLPRVLQARRVLERWGSGRLRQCRRAASRKPAILSWLDPSPQRPRLRRNCPHQSNTGSITCQLCQSWELRGSEAASFDLVLPSGRRSTGTDLCSRVHPGQPNRRSRDKRNLVLIGVTWDYHSRIRTRPRRSAGRTAPTASIAQGPHPAVSGLDSRLSTC